MAGRTRGPSNPSVRRPGKLFDTVGHQAQSPVTQDNWSTLWALGHGPESPPSAGLPSEQSDPSVIRLRELGETAGNRTQAGDTRDSWATR